MPDATVNSTETARRLVIVGALISAILLLTVCIVIINRIRLDPDTVVLISEHNAKWIRFRQPVDLDVRKPQTAVNAFRVQFAVAEVPARAVLRLRALKNAGIFMDKKLIYLTAADDKNWKKEHLVDLAPHLSAGGHEIYIKVENKNGHPAMIADCKALGLFSADHWEATQNGTTWAPALPVDDIQQPSISYQFERSDRAFLSKLDVFLPLFSILFMLSYFCAKRLKRRFYGLIPSPGTVRWLLIVLFAILGANNIGKIAWHIGMDVADHLNYILYVAKYWRIPFAHEGWKMFESPLYYILSAVLYKISSVFFASEISIRILRVIPLLCGMLQIDLCYRALQCVYPQRKDLQILGTVIGGLLPMNVYMSQVVGSEPLAGVLSAWLVVLMLRLLNQPSSAASRESFILIGFVLGLSLLTKISAILLIPPVLFFTLVAIAGSGESNGARIRAYAGRIGLVLGVALLVCGWYYVRNWIEMGRFFIGGWDPSRQISWWQDLGYKTPRQLLVFGASFFYSAYSGVVGIWDSLYSTMWADGFLSAKCGYSVRPMWNYGYMSASLWLSAFPMTAIILGVIRALRDPIQALGKGTLFAAVCVAVYIAAILYLFITLPMYSIGKASYMLGLLPCFGLLAAEGFEKIIRSSPAREISYGVVCCWAVSVYIAYFVK